jgi:hypothetical protein
MRERDESDERVAPPTDSDRELVDRFGVVDPEDVFAGGRVDPALVEASVDALFERFEEDSPEEVMLADRFPSEEAVVPAPAAFDEFAADVATAESPATGERDGSTGRDSDRPGEAAVARPDPEDVVGFEGAPEPGADDASASATGPRGVRAPTPRDTVVETPASDSSEGSVVDTMEASWDGGGADAFEWVTDPAVTESTVSETVLADSESASAFAGGASTEGESEDESVLSRLRSTFPF